MTARTWPIPAHFDAARVAEVFRVPYAERAREAKAFADRHGVEPSWRDARRVGLILVDVQNTFCLPEFELFVAGRDGRGAVDDSARTCAFIYRNLGRLTEIAATLDTHAAAQIFHPVFWVDREGRHPEPHTVISVEDVESGRFEPNPALAKSLGLDPGFDIGAYARHYVRTLHDVAKYPLIVWPYHAMVGGIGHALVPAIEEACFFHGVARQTRTRYEIKGSHPLTEHYSVLRPEVLEDQNGRSVGERNLKLIKALLQYDALVVAGQAKSHCVAWTVGDLLAEIMKHDPALARKVYLLEDCTSPVVVPGVVDFTDPANTIFARFAEAGMRLVKSTDPIESWPGFPAS
jgi:nicotinamidase-related amidase